MLDMVIVVIVVIAVTKFKYICTTFIVKYTGTITTTIFTLQYIVSIYITVYRYYHIPRFA